MAVDAVCIELLSDCISRKQGNFQGIPPLRTARRRLDGPFLPETDLSIDLRKWPNREKQGICSESDWSGPWHSLLTVRRCRAL